MNHWMDVEDVPDVVGLQVLLPFTIDCAIGLVCMHEGDSAS